MSYFNKDLFSEAQPGALNVFTLPPTQTAVEKIYYQEIRPISQLSNSTSPIEFNITGQNGMEYLDLKNSQMYLKVKIKKGNGGSLGSTEYVGPINLLLHALFQQVDVSIQGKVITSSTGHYPYRSMFQTMLKYGNGAKSTQLSAMMWEKDVPGSLDDNDVNSGQNTGLFERAKYFAESNLVDMQGPIMHDLFQMDRYLLNQTALTMKFYRSKPEFYLMTNELGPDYMVEIEDMILKICKIQVSPAIIYSHAQILESQNACYPFVRTEVKMLSIPAGQINVTWDQIFQNVRPNRILVGLVKSQSVAGSYQSSPWNFQNFGITQITLSVDGIPVSGNSMKLVFSPSGGQISLPVFTALYEVTGRWTQDKDLGIKRNDIAEGNCIFAFELEPTFQDGGYMTLTRQGNVRLDLSFSAALQEAVTVVIYSEHPGYFELTKTRDVVTT
ncbi:hypothetical protein FSP39_021829 [Pinctada imbricata]|uniref:Uncharacterized protein n=1 Tax=Pinctada imbricata TaxID=66713 RepID=A0AA88YLI5_PINIB|nr:hypothetical protein FSP39_021829 [Pinctada imbricata]